MYALVKFDIDKKLEIVDSSFIKNFEVKYVKTKRYLTFWSPNSKDTPQSVQKKQGKVVTVDEIKGGNVVAGYYYSCILMVADTTAELEKFLGGKESRKVLTSTDKTKRDDFQTESNEAGNKENEENELKKEETVINTVFSSGDELENVEPKRDQKKKKVLEKKISELEIELIACRNKIEKLKAKNSSLKEKYRSSKNTIASLSELNISLQKKFFSSGSVKNIQHGNNEISVPEFVCLPPPVKFEISGDIPEDIDLSDEKLQSASFRVKDGIQGDRMYAKNLAVLIFGEEVLKGSSVTGARCNAKKDLEAKPPLCQKKLKYLKDLFIQRLNREGGITDEQRTFRLGRINSYIAEKIQTLNRSQKE